MIRSVALSLLALAGCDAFAPSDALLPLADAGTDPALLLSDSEWIAVAAVSDGKAYRFPASGYSVGFSDDGIVGGDISANSFGGHYTAAADGSLSTADVVQTLIGESEEAERLARVMLSELQQGTRFEVDGLTLQVRSPDGDGVRFQRSGYVAQ